jgi:hypothetical protein
LNYSVDTALPQATTLSDVDFARLGISVKDLPALSRSAGEVVAARTGGGVSLAVGMARVFSGLPGMSTLLAYWYHFAIMFEALFILTTIDTGTRIGRFLMQEFLGRMHAELGRSSSHVGGVTASALIVAGWAYFILTGSISTIWPMFGVANQLLACTALCVGTTIVLREAPKRQYALVTLLPLWHRERAPHLPADDGRRGNEGHGLGERDRDELSHRGRQLRDHRQRAALVGSAAWPRHSGGRTRSVLSHPLRETLTFDSDDNVRNSRSPQTTPYVIAPDRSARGILGTPSVGFWTV